MIDVPALLARARAAGVELRRGRRGRLEFVLPGFVEPRLAAELRANRSAIELHEVATWRRRVAEAVLP